MLYLYLERRRLPPLTLAEQCVATLLKAKPRANTKRLFANLQGQTALRARIAVLDRVDLAPCCPWRHVHADRVWPAGETSSGLTVYRLTP
jgi:hypothetical protein